MPDRVAVMARNELRLLGWRVFVFHLVVPVALIAVVIRVDEALLMKTGEPVPGSVQAVPGVALTFLFLLVAPLGLTFFRDSTWGTWARLHTSPARTGEIVASRVIACFAAGAVQMVGLFVMGALFFSMPHEGAVVATLAVAVLATLDVLAIGLVLIAFCRRFQVFGYVSQLLALGVAGTGGALVPVGALPSSISWLAPVTPHYWAMEGFRTTLARGGGLADISGVMARLMVFLLLAGTLALVSYRVDLRWRGY